MFTISMSKISRILDFKAPKDETLTPHQWPPPPLQPSSSLHITPAILLTILILSAIFFISALIHLLIRFFTKIPSSSPSSSSRYAAESSGAIQTQLHELFQLHDSGLDQTAIDALPIFYYNHIIGGGLKEPSDCAVCLCEFSDRDKLRLLPYCRHAFHVQCIDTWLLSHSSCPLCRGSLAGLVVDRLDIIDEEESERVFSVRLGKFRRFDDGEKLSALEVRDEERRGCYLDSRRCYSMGSYQYIEGDLDVQVALSWRARQEHHSRVVSAEEGLRDSFSISKIWLWPKNNSSRFFSMQLPRDNVTTVQNNTADLH